MIKYKYFKSGLYEDVAFYAKHELDSNSDNFSCEDISYDFELLADYYEKHYGFVYKDEEDRLQQTDDQFWDRYSLYSVYLEPIVFNQEIALECDLTPFTYRSQNMLALSGYGMDLSPRLEAYQALVHGTVDGRSNLTSKQGRRWFEQVMGNELTQKVIKNIGYLDT